MNLICELLTFHLSGDIIKIEDAYHNGACFYSDAGTKLISYTYDAWGNFTTYYSNGGATSKATLNPFTYRGYYYDADLGLYYLNCRYYDSVVGRFINADGAISDVGGDIRGYNMYSYCFNNPVNMTDPDGNWPILFLCLAVSIVAQTIRRCLNYAYNSPIEYDTPLYTQGDEPLCWAYCEIMVDDYKTGTQSTQEEATERAWIEAGKKFPTGKLEYSSPSNKTHRFTVTNINSLYMALYINDAPLYALYRNNSTGVAHYIVVTGVDIKNNKVFTNNPWGIKGEQSFEEFCEEVAVRENGNNFGMKLIYLYYNN